MATSKIKSKEGFTIIEVVLVLAVAGLIFLMVFIALPALQRSQRDTQRRQSVSSVVAALTQYQTNHSTKADNLPTADECTTEEATGLYAENASITGACASIKNYMNSVDASENVFVDPDGTEFGLSILDFGDGIVNTASEGSNTNNAFGPDSFDHTIYVIRNSRCDGDVAVQGNGKRNFSVLYMLEGASILCLDNS